ncbi:ABC transporter substrate-binding protein [Vibrio penaeicida]|uniref:ABC transporter substrate-binding protein n=1 Tax=Vibrio penaeicida TaxID=104609 RepID=UPI00191C8C18|nr:ABC transporter substrate-binding protein [Vibrio penaeicida]
MKYLKQHQIWCKLAVTISALFCASTIAATPPSTLVVAKNIDDLATLDPAQIYEFTGGEISNNLYDQLVEYHAGATDTLVGGLASSWHADSAARTITFELDKSARFASGNDVTADDIVYSFVRVMKLNKTPSAVVKQLGWNADNIESQVVKVDDDTVKVHYKEGISPDFALNTLTATVASIVDSKTVKKHEKDGDMGNAWLNKNSAGSGPFSLRIWKANDTVVLSANKKWWEGDLAIKQVIYRHIVEPTTQRIMLEKGDIDIARGLGPDQIQAIATHSELKIEDYPQSAVYFFSFNVKNNKLNNPEFWRAAKYLIDYKGMANSFLKGQFKVHQAFWPQGMPGAVSDTPYSLDVAKAKQILTDAKIENLSLKMDYINSEPFSSMAQSIQATFAEAGIKIDLVPGTGNQVITKYRAREHEGMLLYWGPDYADPHSNAGAFAYNANNDDDHYVSTTTWRNGWQDLELNKKVEAALQETDRDKRLQQYRDLQHDVMKTSPIVVMFQNQAQTALRSNINGYEQGSSAHQVYYSKVTK